jgi:hypothetical protein
MPLYFGILAVIILITVVAWILYWKQILIKSKNFFLVEAIIIAVVGGTFAVVKIVQAWDDAQKDKENKKLKKITVEQAVDLMRAKGLSRFNFKIIQPYLEDIIRVGDEGSQVDVYFALFKETDYETKIMFYVCLDNPINVLHRRDAGRLETLELIWGTRKLRSEFESMAEDLAPIKRSKQSVKMVNQNGQVIDLGSSVTKKDDLPKQDPLAKPIENKG